jgi:5-methylcytosine-specific restriction endonuclease McrA
MYKNNRRIASSTRTIKIVGFRQKWKCKLCGEMLKSTFQIDHKRALKDGGTNDLNNLQALCCECHAEKTQREYITPQQKALFCHLCKCYYSRFFPNHKCYSLPKIRPVGI